MEAGGALTVITGMKHTGKSTVGALIASKTGKPFYDTDALIRELSGKTARELFDEGGSALMAQWETKACAFLAGKAEEAVVATGGAFCENGAAIDALKGRSLFAYLDTPFELLWERVQKSAERDGRFPLFLQGGDPRSLFAALYEKRSALYAAFADIVILTGTDGPDAVAQDVLSRLDRFPHPSRFR